MRPSRSDAAAFGVWRWAGGVAFRTAAALLIGLCALLVPEPALSQGGGQAPPPECCLVLLLPVGARSAALGQAGTALGSPDAVFVNPAGLAEMRRGQFVVHHEPLLHDQQANTFTLVITPRAVGALALTYQLFDYGEEDARDEFGNTTGRLSTREQLLVASFATPVHGGLTAGINYKLYQFRVDCAGFCRGANFVGTTHALDGGLRFRPRQLPGLVVGASVLNLGFALQVVNAPQSDPMPTRIRAGAAYEVLHHFARDSTLALWVSADVEDRPGHLGSPQAGLGVEGSIGSAVFVRMGYRSGEGRGTGPAVGLGLSFDRFTAAVARSFASTGLELDHEPFQFSFGVQF
jgi:hypothetical protein